MSLSKKQVISLLKNKANILFVIIIFFYIIKIVSFFVLGMSFRDIDAAFNTHAYELAMIKGGNPVTQDFLIQRDEGFIINRTYGTYGVPAGFLMLVDDDLYYGSPFLLISFLLVVIAFFSYLVYAGQVKDKKKLFAIVVFGLTLFSYRSIVSMLWGQWAFLVSLVFSMAGIYFYKRMMKEPGYTNALFVLISLFVSIQVHQLCFFVGFFGIVSIMLNQLINKKLERNLLKKSLMIFVLLVLSQLPFLNNYLELLWAHGSKVGGFNITEAFVLNNRYGYTQLFFNSYLSIWGISLVLMPLGLFYAFKTKKFTYLIWFVLVFIISRPSLIPITKVQLRLTVALPIIGAMIAADGSKIIAALLSKKFTFPIIAAVVMFNLIIIMILPAGPNPLFNLIQPLSWVNENIEGGVFTTNFQISDQLTWWSTTISGNRFFSPIVEDEKVLLTNYEDLSGLYNITHLLRTSDGGVYNNVLYDDGRFVVIKV